jgi:hypothetical protein
MDPERFSQACSLMIDTGQLRSGIGTLGEKTLHAVLKHYIDPDPRHHEVRIGPYYADIASETGIYEIQTRGFGKMRKKLETFLQTQPMPVTIVYPVPATKWLLWIDPETGELTQQRKSPKKGTPYEIFYELYQIKSFLTHPNLRIRILLIDMQEYRYLNGWSKDKKRGSSRCNRIPTALVDDICVDRVTAYASLVPAALPASFTSKDFAGVSGLSLSSAQIGLNVLHDLGAINRVGKTGRRFVYNRNFPVETYRIEQPDFP